MEKRPGKAFVTILLIALTILAFVRLGQLRESSHVAKYKSRIMMDTVVSIQVHRGQADQIDQAIEMAFAEMKRLDDLLSAWTADSDVSRINQAAGGEMVSVDGDTWEIIDRIQDLSTLTRGAFDITIGAVLKLWDFSSPEATVPAPEAIQTRLPLVGADQILVNENDRKIGLRQRGACIDLGGAAKGYAVDRAAEVLADLGVEAAVVDAGGDIRLLGEKPDGGAWSIGIRHPQDTGTIIEVIDVDSGAVATSGNYERFFTRDGIRYHHILNPQTGLPAPHVASVTVLAPTALEADLLSTAVFVLGPVEGLTLIEQLHGIEGVIYAEEGDGLRRIASSGFPKQKK